MRLTSFEKQQIKEVVHGFDSKAKIYLHGSRVRDDLKGGDIDLLLISEILDFHAKVSILVELKKRMGDQKIDLILSTVENSRKDPFIKQVFEKGEEI